MNVCDLDGPWPARSDMGWMDSVGLFLPARYIFLVNGGPVHFESALYTLTSEPSRPGNPLILWLARATDRATHWRRRLLILSVPHAYGDHLTALITALYAGSGFRLRFAVDMARTVVFNLTDWRLMVDRLLSTRQYYRRYRRETEGVRLEACSLSQGCRP